jgi:hypothetical protein
LTQLGYNERNWEKYIAFDNKKTRANEISTNGITICLKYDKTRPSEPIQPDLKLIDEHVGVDPGMKENLVGAYKAVGSSFGDRSYDSGFHLSNKCYKVQSGIVCRRRKLLKTRAMALERLIEKNRKNFPLAEEHGISLANSLANDLIQFPVRIPGQPKSLIAHKNPSKRKRLRNRTKNKRGIRTNVERRLKRDRDRDRKIKRKLKPLKKTKEKKKKPTDDEVKKQKKKEFVTKFPNPIGYADVTRFKLKWHKVRCDVWLKKQIGRIDYSKFIHVDRFISKTIREKFLRGHRCVSALVGDAKFSAKSPIKKYIRFPFIRFCHVLKYHRNIHYLPVWEYNTSKNCSKCFGKVKIPKSPYRYVYCRSCKRTLGRDMNSGNNMLQLDMKALRN